MIIFDDIKHGFLWQRLGLVGRAHDEGRREVGLALRPRAGVQPVLLLSALGVSEQTL